MTTPIQPETHAIAYAGVPLFAVDDMPFGVLCVVDYRPRDWTDSELALLHEYAAIIQALMRSNGDLEIETQIRQSLKLEAVGRLAGGIAHDFNNILTAIRGHAELLLDEVASADPRRLDIEEIRRSTERAAFLTHQLLAFSRKQILQPRVLELASRLPVWAEKMRANLHESVTLQLQIDPAVAPINADPFQIEAALASIVANARDAMPAGGEITITARSANLDEAFASASPYRVQTGPYARITITDNGHGMDEETLQRVFEPFFTTREPARGAGLGLSTAYGIIKQSGGYIWAESTLGRGTTFEILLPRYGNGEGADASPAAPAAETAAATILLVEDEDVVRSVAHRILDRNGYRILEARNGVEALDIAETHEGAIHLLISDLTMPGMSGRELAERLAALRPDTRVLFVSGYTEDDGFRRSIDQLGAFLEKPFSPEDLCHRVRQILLT